MRGVCCSQGLLACLTVLLPRVWGAGSSPRGPELCLGVHPARLGFVSVVVNQLFWGWSCLGCLSPELWCDSGSCSGMEDARGRECSGPCCLQALGLSHPSCIPFSSCCWFGLSLPEPLHPQNVFLSRIKTFPKAALAKRWWDCCKCGDFVPLSRLWMGWAAPGLGTLAVLQGTRSLCS